MYEIIVEDEFSAAHFLKLYDGSWEKRHGHDFKVAVTVQAEKLDSMGVVTDFEALKPALKGVLKSLLHIAVNDHPEFKGEKLNPSTENIAKIIFSHLQKNFDFKTAKLTKVTVWETPDAQASYYGGRES